MRYFKIWLAFLKMSWMADMQYRLNIVTRVFGDVVWYSTQLSVFEILFRHVDNIGDWNIHGMRVFMGTLFVIDGIFMVIFHENLDQFSSLVRRGDIDMYLVKPINSQFLTSCKKIGTAFIINVMGVTGYLIWAVQQLPHPVTALHLANFVVVALCGLMILYAIRFLFCCLAVIFQNSNNIGFLFFQIYRMGMRPDPFYPVWLRYIILSVLPVAFFASVPARSLVEGPNFQLSAIAIALMIFLLKISNMFWKFSLRKHSSASS